MSNQSVCFRITTHTHIRTMRNYESILFEWPCHVPLGFNSARQDVISSHAYANTPSLLPQPSLPTIQRPIPGLPGDCFLLTPAPMCNHHLNRKLRNTCHLDFGCGTHIHFASMRVGHVELHFLHIYFCQLPWVVSLMHFWAPSSACKRKWLEASELLSSFSASTCQMSLP